MFNVFDSISDESFFKYDDYNINDKDNDFNINDKDRNCNHYDFITLNNEFNSSTLQSTDKNSKFLKKEYMEIQNNFQKEQEMNEKNNENAKKMRKYLILLKKIHNNFF